MGTTVNPYDEIGASLGLQPVKGGPASGGYDDVARQVFAQSPSFAAAATTSQPEPTLLERMKQHGANTLGGAIRGAGSIGATLLWPIDKATDLYRGDRGPSMSGLITGQQPKSRNEERRQDMDAALSDLLGSDPQSLVYRGSKVGSEVAGTLGVAGLLGKAAQVAGASPDVVRALATAGFSTRAPGVAAPTTLAARGADLALRTAAGGTVGAASAGLVDPKTAETGALIGAAMPGAVQAAGTLGQQVSQLAGRVFRPGQETADLARSAIAQGIPLGASDVTTNPAVRGARSFLDDVPLIGRIGGDRKAAVQEGFNAAVGKTFGADAPKLTPQVMDSARGAIRGELDRVWSNNPLQLDGQLLSDLAAIRNRASAKLNTEQAAQVERQIQELLQKARGLAVDGGFANNWQSEVRMLAEGEKGLHQSILSDLRRSVLAAFNRSVSPQDAAALTDAMSKYRAIQTVQPLMDKAEAGVAGRMTGNVPAGLLSEAVRARYGSASRSPFGDLPQIGSQFVADRVARTGGSARALVQNSALGTGLTLGAWHNPMVPVVAIPAAGGLEALLSSPGVARAILGVPRGAAGESPLLLQLLSRSAPQIAADQ